MNNTRPSRRRVVLKPLLIALAAVALPGCAVGPDYRAPQLPAAQPVADTALDPAFYSADEPPAQFWSSFGDAGLDALEARALAANHDLRIALANLNQARALRREAFLDYLPTVTAGAGYTVAQRSADQAPGYSRDDRHSELYDAGFDAAWELDLFGRVRRLNEASRANEEALAADLRAAQLSVAAEVARTYFELRGAQARLAVAERNADNQLGTLNYTEARFAYGRGTELDRERARAQLAATRARVPDLRTAVANAEHRLAVLAGLAPSALRDELDAPQALPPLPRLVQIGQPEALLRRRPDVASAERQLAAATAGIGVAVADYFPRVSFTGEAGFSVAHLASVGDGGSDRYAFGPSISWAAFDLGRVQARVAQRRAGADAALARYEQSVLRALEETANTLVGYGQNRRKLDLLDAGAQASARAVQLARVRFEAGAADFIDVLDAERSLLDAEDQLAQARTQTATSLVALYKSLGGGWQGAAPQTLSRKD
ncbi:efflux transporter outer membrane subunit [Solimonas variicoloris]|uniref:efflux transporter outer membrane subunit n=1 Tax=Solimonas variicoloris TaxID=254408 RepID=UPI00039F643B|nr:efflux transporter outer membrane subunit [Solimonas variicoloris]